MGLDRDLLCAACGYNLRTLAADDACPECGVRVADSLAPDDLATAPPAWLGKQLAGAWIQCASYLLAAGVIVMEMFRDFFAGMPIAAKVALRIAPLLGIAVAAWMLTTPRPDRRVRRSTLLVRYGFAAALALAMILPGVEHAGFKTMPGRLGWTLFFALLVVCWIGLGCVQARIARTLNLPRLGVLIWTASIVWSVALGATALFYVFREFTERSLFSRAEPAYVYTLLAGGVLVILSTAGVAVGMTARGRVRCRSASPPGSPPSPHVPFQGS